MLLKSVEIKNYRSLEDVRLGNLQKLNVTIGRNNAGKSSIFRAIALINDAFNGRNNPPDVLTAQDLNRSLEIYLVFGLQEREREDFIRLLIEAGHSDERYNTLLNSPLLRQVAYCFKTPVGSAYPLHLYETRIQAEDGKWGVVQKMVDNERMANPRSNFIDIGALSKVLSQVPLDSTQMDINNNNQIHQLNLHTQFPAQTWYSDRATIWLQNRLAKYLSNAFFFNPFRHSRERLEVQQTPTLAQDGSNLAQVLHTINSNDRAKFQEIEQFIHAALPDVGQLQTPLIGNQTEVAFRSRRGNYLTRLHDMGGGIEQLLMVATVLLTTGDESTLFVEEPESHLHAGAQRFLLEKLYEGERQVFITTHSPTFVNVTRPHSVHRVTYVDERTKIEPCNDKLADVLEDIGVRNSDIFLSDAVLFIEGPSDKDVLDIWSKTLGLSFAERNITPLVMGGGQHAARGVPIRSDVLAGISGKASIPHLFLLDRDERSQAEIDHLEKRLGDRVHILAARELENYLIVPRAMLAALRAKHCNDAATLEKLVQSSEEQIKQMIHAIANDLYITVLLKRIRSELGGLSDGLLPRESLSDLVPYALNTELEEQIVTEVQEQISRRLAKIDDIVISQKETLGGMWIDPMKRLLLAPGEEVIGRLFEYFGSQYRKTSDAVRIAREMHADEIDSEIQVVITKVGMLV